MQILFVPAVAYSSREKDERNVRERESERNEQNWKLSFSLSLFPLFYPLKARRRTEYGGQHVREAFLTRVTRRNRNPLLRRRFGLAHWLPVPVTRFGANWRPRLISKLQNIFTLLWFSTPPPPPLLLHSFARLSLSLSSSVFRSASLLPGYRLILPLLSSLHVFFLFLFSSLFFPLFFFTRFLPRFFPLHSFRLYPRNSRGFDAHVKAGAERQSGISWIRRTTFRWDGKERQSRATSVIVPCLRSRLFIFGSLKVSLTDFLDIITKEKFFLYSKSSMSF